MDHASRRASLGGRLEKLEADALFVTRLPNVRYLSGFTGSNGQLLLTDEEAVFMTDGRYAEQSRAQVPDMRREIYGGDAMSTLARACADLDVSKVAFEAAGVTYKGYTELSGLGLELVPTTGEVERVRWVKDEEERQCLRDAQAIADEAFERICAKLAEGITERQAAFELDAAMRQAGAEGLAFDTIMAFGESAAEPHHHPTNRPLRGGDVIKVDFGCVVGGYHSDMTRTVGFGELPGQLQEIYEVVKQAQQAGEDSVRAGVTGGEADRVCREIISEAGYGPQFRHPLGHGVGLEIHEGPALRAGSTDVLPEGAVVTVEPGIYLEGLGGVRIEDMVEVGAEGCRVVPRTPKELLIL